MSDIAIRVENCILSAGEGLSKFYPARALRAGRIGAFQRRPDTLRDALTNEPLATNFTNYTKKEFVEFV